MKVILLQELRGKGGEGDVIDVAQGYAENCLYRKGIALPATKGNLKQLEERRRNIQKREIKRVEDAEAVKAMLDGKQVSIDARVGEEGQLYGSVTSTMIADAILDQLGITVDRRRVELKQPIKQAGVYVVDVNLYREITAPVTVQVGSAEDIARIEEAEDEGVTAEEVVAELDAETAGDDEANAPADALGEELAEGELLSLAEEE